MQFNITFFVQIFNFFITYWFLNKFMFKPVINFIKKREKKEKAFINNIKNEESLLLDLEKQKKLELYNFQQKVKSKYKLSPMGDPNIPTKIEIFIDTKEVESMTNLATKILVERVPNVD